MKKKLNLLWNLKFNFFSVAERPLTFFAYFLNAKKVGRRRLVISPAKAGAFLFSHTRLPLSAPALAPVRSHFACGETGLAGHRPRLLGLPRKSGRGISLRETTLCGCPLRGHGFATPHRYFAVPVTAAPRRGPNGKTPALARRSARISPPAKPGWPVVAPAGGNVLATPFSLRSNVAPRSHPGACSPFGSHFASGETARPVVAPAGGNVLATPFSLPSNVAPRSHPGACRRSAPFRLRRNRAAGRCPRRGQRARYPIFAPLKCGPALAPRRSLSCL